MQTSLPFLLAAAVFASAALPSAQAQTCTQSVDNTVVADGVSVRCGSTQMRDNQYYRRYSFTGDCATPDGQLIRAVRYGIESAVAQSGGMQPGRLKLYSIDPSDPLLLGNMTLIHDQAITIPDGDDVMATVFVDEAVCVRGDVDLVIEIGVPDAVLAGTTDSFWMGANTLGASAPSYLSGAGCSIGEPTDVAGLFPDIHWVMDIEFVTPFLGTPYCGALANSSGGPAELFAFGSDDASLNDFGLFVCDGVPGEFVFILGSFGQDSVMNPGGGLNFGELCLGGGMPIARFVDTSAAGTPTGATHSLGMFDPDGIYLVPLDIHNVPLGSMAGSNTVLMNGQSFNFQAYYRDTPTMVGSANFSTAIEVTFP